MTSYLEVNHAGLLQSYRQAEQLMAQNPVGAMMMFGAIADQMIQDVIVCHNIPIEQTREQYRKLGRLRRYNLIAEEYKASFEAIYHLRNQAIHPAHAQTACAHIGYLFGWFEQVMQPPPLFLNSSPPGSPTATALTSR